MLTDIIIGIIIGIGLERALKVSLFAQKAIKQIKENRKNEIERKKSLTSEPKKE